MLAVRGGQTRDNDHAQLLRHGAHEGRPLAPLPALRQALPRGPRGPRARRRRRAGPPGGRLLRGMICSLPQYVLYLSV